VRRHHRKVGADDFACYMNPVQVADGEVKAPGSVPATVGAQVPPSTEFYILLHNGLATAGHIHRVAQSRVVPVDPTTTRVVQVIPQ
jgi:hypothetical protein